MNPAGDCSRLHLIMHWSYPLLQASLVPDLFEANELSHICLSNLPSSDHYNHMQISHARV